MCTSIVEIAPAEGMAKREGEWFPLTQVAVAYDHARHALLGDVITMDFINTHLPPDNRAAVESRWRRRRSCTPHSHAPSPLQTRRKPSAPTPSSSSVCQKLAEATARKPELADV
ncbi:MAG: DUF6295 family protein [Hyphomicrobiaceae bacterium]